MDLKLTMSYATYYDRRVNLLFFFENISMFMKVLEGDPAKQIHPPFEKIPCFLTEAENDDEIVAIRMILTVHTLIITRNHPPCLSTAINII